MGQKRKHNRSEVLAVVEEGDDDQGEFLDRARQEGCKTVAYPKTYAQAFQAGDLAGWKCRTLVTNALNAPLSAIAQDAENALRSLDPIRGIVHNNGAYDRALSLLFAKRVRFVGDVRR